MRGKLRILLIAALVLGTVSACDSVAYYAQAVTGQVSLLWQRQSIDRLLSDPALEPVLRQKLLVIQQATVYAERNLGLPTDGSYGSYVELERRHLVWNVFAAPPFSTQPVSWCFPIAGCVDYRGYFSEAAALNYAEGLRKQGLDVYVGGVDAYSTLGWFNDPIPSTVIQRPEHQFVALIFHELAHQKLYLPGDTAFNESFASFVSQEGLRRWLDQQSQPELYLQSVQDLLEQQRFIDFVLEYRERFAALFGSSMGAADMAEQKQLLQQQMRQSWRQDREHREEKGHSGSVHDRYQTWFQGPLNNAQLSTVGSYYTWVPAFAALFDLSGRDFAEFYRAVGSLAAQTPDSRQERLRALMPAG
jgi:predicted aminopeptidase